MYKYMRYVGILLWTAVRKLVGLVWYFVAVPFRRYARNVVYNYVLSNNIYLKRLLERKIEAKAASNGDYYYTIAPNNGSNGGFIITRHITWLEYQFVYWFIWGWLDDDSYCDTTSEKFLEEHLADERNNQLHIDSKLVSCLAKCNGNAFDRGDAIEDNWCGYMSIKWNIRNTAYNFKYMQWEENRPEMLFYHKIGSWQFGYLPDGKRKGRLVFGGL